MKGVTLGGRDPYDLFSQVRGFPSLATLHPGEITQGSDSLTSMGSSAIDRLRGMIDNQLTVREIIRVSKDKSGRERSPEEQHDDNQRACDRHQWSLGEFYSDIGSASRYATKKRKNFDRLMRDLEMDTFNAQILVMWESARGSRRESEWMRLIELCEDRHVKIYVTTHDRIYDPANGRDRRSLLEDAIDSAYETWKTSERVHRGLNANAENGWPHAHTNYGYKRIYDDRGHMVKQVIVPREAALIRELFKRIRRGDSLRSIELDWKARGVVNRKGVPFVKETIRSMATKVAYIGLRSHFGELTQAVWPPIIKDRALFYDVQKILGDPKRRTNRGRPGRGVHLLSMIGMCGACGSTLTYRLGRKDYRVGFYSCKDRGCVMVRESELDELATNKILNYLAGPDVYTDLSADHGDNIALRAAENDQADIQAEYDDLVSRVGAGTLTAEFAEHALPAIVARLTAATERVNQLRTPARLVGLIDPGADVTQHWFAARMSARREIARLLLSPSYLGELRVNRKPNRCMALPVGQRVTWSKDGGPSLR